AADRDVPPLMAMARSRCLSPRPPVVPHHPMGWGVTGSGPHWPTLVPVPAPSPRCGAAGAEVSVSVPGVVEAGARRCAERALLPGLVGSKRLKVLGPLHRLRETVQQLVEVLGPLGEVQVSRVDHQQRGPYVVMIVVIVGVDQLCQVLLRDQL